MESKLKVYIGSIGLYKEFIVIYMELICLYGESCA